MLTPLVLSAERNDRNAAGYIERLGETCMCKQRKSQNEQAESEADSERDGNKRMHGFFTESHSFHKINWAPSPVVTQ